MGREEKEERERKLFFPKFHTEFPEPNFKGFKFVIVINHSNNKQK